MSANAGEEGGRRVLRGGRIDKRSDSVSGGGGLVVVVSVRTGVVLHVKSFGGRVGGSGNLVDAVRVVGSTVNGCFFVSVGVVDGRFVLLHLTASQTSTCEHLNHFLFGLVLLLLPDIPFRNHVLSCMLVESRRGRTGSGRRRRFFIGGVERRRSGDFVGNERSRMAEHLDTVFWVARDLEQLAFTEEEIG
jgi:hypothetical protein